MSTIWEMPEQMNILLLLNWVSWNSWKNNAAETTGNWNQPRDVLRIYQWKSRKRDDLIGYYLFLFFCKSNQICFINHESHVKTNTTTNSKFNITIKTLTWILERNAGSSTLPLISQTGTLLWRWAACRCHRPLSPPAPPRSPPPKYPLVQKVAGHDLSQSVTKILKFAFYENTQ